MKKIITTIVSLISVTTIANATLYSSDVDACYYSDDVSKEYNREYGGCTHSELSEPDENGIIHLTGECKVYYRARTIFGKDKIGRYSFERQEKMKDKVIKYRVLITSSRTLTEPDNTCKYKNWRTRDY